MRGHVETVRVLVEDCGALVDSKDPSGNTALHYCFSSFYDPLFESRSKEDHAETSKVLLEMGADPNARNAEGEMPLHLATKNGYEKGIEILLMMGANCGDEARNSAGNRPVDLLSDKSGVSASILKTAARDPRGFLNETLEAMSRRGPNNSSTNISLNGSNVTVAKFSNKFPDSPRLPGLSTVSPRLLHNRLAGRTSTAPGILGNSQQTSLESINRMNQFSKNTSQIEMSVGQYMNDNDGYLVPQEIPFIDDQTIDQLYKERIQRTLTSPTKSERRPSQEFRKSRHLSTHNGSIGYDVIEDSESLPNRSPSKDRNRKKTPVLSKKSQSENGSSSLWEVTPNASVISTVSGPKEDRKSRKIINGICNLSNVFEESSTSCSENNRRMVEESISQALKSFNRHQQELNNISDYDDSFDTVSESDEETTLKRTGNNRKVISPNTKQSPRRSQSTNQKRIRSDGSVSSSFDSGSSSSNSVSIGRHRAPPPIPGDQSPFELEEVGSCKRLFNVEVDGNQLNEWTIMKFNPVFPSRPSSTFLVRTHTAKKVIKSLDNERFLNKLSKNGFNLPNCSTEGLQLSHDDFLGHEYENTAPGPHSVKYVVKLCMTENRFEWSKEVVKPPILPKKNAMEKVGNKLVNGDKDILSELVGARNQNNLRKTQVPSSCSETDSFISGTSSSSNEINSFIPREARKKLPEHQKQITTDIKQNGIIKKGFGLQKETTNYSDVRKSWRAQKTHSQAGIELDKSPRSKRNPLTTSPVKGNSISAEDILDRVDQTTLKKGVSRKDPSSTYLNYEDAQELKRMKSQQNVLDWVSNRTQENPESSEVSDGESTLYKRSKSFKNASKPHSNQALLKSRAKTPTPSVYEQLEDDSGFHRHGNGMRKSGKAECRIVLFESSENLGFSITGGNAYGIIVKDVQMSSEAQTAGLRMGDELLEVNGRSLDGRSKEEAFKLLERCSGRIELKVKRNHEKRISYENGDKFFVQACFDFTNPKSDSRDDGVSSVKQGEIFCVIDSKPENKDEYWKVYRAESNSKEEIYIPNKSKAIGIMAKALVESGTFDKKSKGQGIFRSFRRNKSIDNDAKYSGINSEFLKPYRNVILVPPQVKRPVFIAGLFSEAICRRLIADSPGLFEIPDKIVEVSRFVPDIPTQLNGSLQRSISNSSLSPIDVEPLREISAKGKHPLCCLSPKGIEFVRQQSDLNPIAIFLSCPNKQVVKDVATALTATNVDVRKANVVNSMFENSLRFEKYYSNLFDAILPFRSDSSWYSILKDTIAKMQIIPKWRTVELLDECEDSTLVRSKQNGRILDSENRHSKTTDDLPEHIIGESFSRSKSQRKASTSKFFPMKSAQSMSEL